MRYNNDRRGQIMIFMALTMPVIFGMTAIVFDFGMVYINQNRLNGSTQAAALAGAEAMAQAGATTATVTAAATLYSGVSGDDNANSGLTGVSMASGYPALSCLSTLQNSFGINCYGPGSSNAIQVKQQVSAPLYFLGLFGFNSINLTATATASMKGANVSPFNIAIIIDTTQSMTSTDSDSSCNNSRINCALAGVQVLLKNLAPCLVSESSCGTVTGGMVSNSVDRVSLMAFPAVTALTAADDTNCGSTNPTTAAYTSPFPLTSTYQIVNFSSDYRASDASPSLNTGSNLVAAVVGPHGTPCLKVKGGFGTYYAQVIQSAQAYLVAEQALYPNSKNAMILLSDGDATATCKTSLAGVCLTGDMPGASTTSGTYMSTLQECHQAVTAAAAAAAAGTRVYSVAYGAASSGCASDTNPSITPCQTMQRIASSPGYFFSDYTATGGSSSCISAAQPVTSLSQIFQVIAGDFTVARLIPNNTN
jgi:Flp pilus assembly protein TadG